MTTLVTYNPQLRFGEVELPDGTLESLLEDLDGAKAALVEAKAYLGDYLDTLPLDGEYRVGRFRLAVGSRRTTSVSVPKPKQARR